MAIGITVQESGTRQRERRIAARRRDLAERIKAVDAYRGVNQIIWDARDRLRRETVLHAAWPLVIDQDDDPEDAAG